MSSGRDTLLCPRAAGSGPQPGLTHPSCHCPPRERSYGAEPNHLPTRHLPDVRCLRCLRRRCCSAGRAVRDLELVLWRCGGLPGTTKRGPAAGRWGHSWEALGTPSASADCAADCRHHWWRLQNKIANANSTLLQLVFFKNHLGSLSTT